MNKFRQSAYVLPLVALLFLVPAFGWDDQSTMSGEKTGEHQTELSMSGSLKSVDPDSKTLVISCSDASTGNTTEAEFTYDESTTIMGAQSTIEGLSTSSGSQVTVYYKEDDGKKKATRIEVQAASTTPEAQPTPSPTPDPSQPQPDPSQPGQPQPDPSQPGQPEPMPGTPPGA